MKKQIVIALSLLLAGFIHAQKNDNYFHLSIGAGRQSFDYKLLDGTSDAQLGYTINVAYSHFLTKNWGLQIGLGAQSFSTLSTLNYQASIPNITDVVGDVYEFRDNYKDWKEKQQALFLDIPLLAQYRHYINSKTGIMLSAGAKISIPMQASYKTVGGEMVTTGYYSKWNAVLHDLPQYGFTTYTNNYKDNLSLKTAYLAISDFGCLYKLSEKLELYAGGYINYGLNNIIATGTKSVYEPDGMYNGFFGSDRLKKVAPIAFGVKVGMYWKVIRNPKSVKEVPEIQSIVPVQANLKKKPQAKIVEIADKNVGTVESNKLKVRDSVSKSIDTSALPPNSIAVSSVIKTPEQQIAIPENDFNKNNQSLSTISPNIKSDTVSNKLQSGSKSIVENYNSPKVISNTSTASSGQSEKVSTVDSVNKTASRLPVDISIANVSSSTQGNKVVENSVNVDSDGDGTPDNLDMCPNLAGVASNRGCPEISRRIILLFIKALTGIKFDSGKDKLKKRSYTILNEIAKELIKNPAYFIEVHGHTDSKGNSRANKLLSELRASAVRNYLIRRGVDGNRIKSVGYGDKMPVATNKTVKGRTLNRRVEFNVTFE
ncbi:OmpA/MotB domain protein [Paludibacter propionicigenes WB4]|uniref:OmpA/MotB domain protein n=1 Tax=Paludibacter propionicigenes (strain DSM 17365 / JCM 13257 / WB4) TaxID=694427 RepID=E4T0M6_PALPW|nr:OmpA family protein [Paludibacter propionicigenes]ADQ81090.1 OmpA/MotB domain protein [Paludibacter propionicigenes WB4]